MLDFSVTFCITIINIAILFFILRAILFKPVTKFINERAGKIQDAVDQAEKAKNQAKALNEQYQEQLRNVKAEAEVIMRAARETAEQESVRIVTEGKARAEELITNARKQIETDQNAARTLFQAEAAALVIAAASRLLQREISQEDSRIYAGRILQELGKRD